MNFNEARIYVGTYKKYNNGSLFGEWFDLSDFADKDEFYEKIQDFHKDEEDPEFMFQDFENIPSCYISESHISSEFWDLMELTEDWDENKIESFFEWLNDWGHDNPTEQIQTFEECIYGYFDSMLDFAYEFVKECYNLSDFVSTYFDYEKFARDLEYDYNIYNGIIVRIH
jgi:antirestriction protein